MLQQTSSGTVEPEAPTPASATAVGPPPERPFVGRRAELALLRTGIASTVQRAASFFLISGEAGVGKTRLASEFAREVADSGTRVAWGRCWEAGGAPSYWPWVEIIRQLIGDQEIVDLGAHGRFLAQLVPDLASRLGAAGFAAPAPSDPESARFLMFDAVCALLRRRAREAPLLVLLDDLHRGDRASLLLLSFVVGHSADVPLLLVATTRDGEGDIAADLRAPLAEISRRATRIELRGLTRHDITALLEGSPRAREDLAGRIHDATDGNAFFVDEVLRSLAAGDPLAQDRATPTDLRVPSGVRDAVRLRLATLSPASVAVLESAAVVGREFEASVVARCGAQAPAAVLAALEHPVNLGIVTESASRAGRFQFRHALIRDALYDALPAARRLALHQKIAEAFEALAAAAPDRYLGELAHHFLIAAAYGDTRFIQHASRAAQRALTRMAFEEAVTLYQRAIDALIHVDCDDRQRCELLLALAQAREWNNESAASREAFEQAAEIARRLDATDLFVRAALGVGAVAARKFTATAIYQSAPLLIREALQRGSGSFDDGTSALLRCRLAVHELSSGERARASELSAKAVALARRSQDKRTLAEALIVRHAVLSGPDGMDERRAIADEVIGIGNELVSAEIVMRGHALRFTVAFESGDMRGADHDLEQHRVLAESLADPFDRWASLVWHGARMLLSGRFDDARAFAQRAFDLTVQLPGLHRAEINGPSAFAGQMILIPDTATQDLPAGLIKAGSEGQFPALAAWRVAALLAYVRANDAAAVVLELEQLTAQRFDDFERNGAWLGTMAILAEAISFVGDRARAELLYEVLTPYGSRNGTISLVASFGSISRYLGLLAATLDRVEDAERHFLAATEMNRSMGALPHLAMTLFDHARLLVRRPDDDQERGIELLHRARAIAVRLGMPGLLRDCDSLLTGDRQAGGRGARGGAGYALERQGDAWTLRYDGKQMPVRHSKGVAYIAELLRQPNRDILAIDLLAGLAPETGTTPGPTPSQDAIGGTLRRGHFVDKVFDSKARQAYEARVEDLECALSRAEADGDPERVLELRDELALLEQELARGVGLGGRSRQISDVERARVSVTRAIRLALGRIANAAPEAGATLGRRIRTGTYCCYALPGGSP
jgi:tetratricopeptide (TPR) repeat protein